MFKLGKVCLWGKFLKGNNLENLWIMDILELFFCKKVSYVSEGSMYSGNIILKRKWDWMYEVLYIIICEVIVIDF